MKALWGTVDCEAWTSALGRYRDVLAEQGVEELAELDHFVREVLPSAIAARDPRKASVEELVEVTRWKMKRGVWRARNLALVRGNDPGAVEGATQTAFAAIPDHRKPVAILAELDGVGPATASALLAAVAPETYPFLDDLVASGIPELGAPRFTVPFYLKYAEALRRKAVELSRVCGRDWAANDVANAMWARAGGKAGLGAVKATA